MKVVTLRGTWEVNLQDMKVRRADGSEVPLKKVPSPVVGERMEIETSEGRVSTEPVTEVTP
jgi:hypothetical protein